MLFCLYVDFGFCSRQLLDTILIEFRRDVGEGQQLQVLVFNMSN